MAYSKIIVEILSIFLGIVTTVLCMTIPKRKMWITLIFGFATGFLMFIDCSNGIIRGVLIAGISGLISCIIFVSIGLRVQNNAKKGWDEYKLTHKQ